MRWRCSGGPHQVRMTLERNYSSYFKNVLTLSYKRLSKEHVDDDGRPMIV